jgi:cell division septation protein DedD
MIKYILELVKENNRVIIPGFGAFIVSKDNGYNVLFNNFLSFNDGLLANHVAAELGVDTVDALKRVSDFVELLKRELDEKGAYEMSGLGRFTKDDNGVLRFNQASEVNPNVEVPESKPVQHRDLLDIAPQDEAVTFIEESPKIEHEIPPSLRKEKLLQIDHEEPAPVKAAAPKPTVTKEKPAPVKPVVKASPPPKIRPEVHVHEERKKRSMAWFILLFVFIPLLGGALYLAFWHKKKVVEDSLAPIEVVTDTNEHPQIEPLQTEPPVITEPQVSSAMAGYHVIAGTFSNESQANEFVLKMREKGFSAAVVIPRGNKFLVSLDSRTDFIEAEARQEEIVNTYRIENYLLLIR